MASTLLEETRQLHEDIERLERLIVKEFKLDASTHKEKLLQTYRARQMLELMQQRAKALLSIYEDADGARKEEIATLRGDNPFAIFYDRLKEVKEYHRKFGGDEEITGAESEHDASLRETNPKLHFSGEEGLGRFLDLYELHQTWQNAEFGSRVDYAAYVQGLPTHLTGIPHASKGSSPYKQYVGDLLGYLESFYQRSQPLAQLGRLYGRLEEEFEGRWQTGHVPGWEDYLAHVPWSSANGKETSIDLSKFESADELELLGPERLKAALAELGLKCGGTVHERAVRLMAVKGKRLQDVDPSLFAKNGAKGPRLHDVYKRLALNESKITRLCDAMSSTIADTIGRIEKRQSQTYEERLAELEEEEEANVQGAAGAEEEEEEEEEEYVYNPLKLPLGWDGKPIPYWLYKLHGLNLEYKCEICGGASYWGRRAFERHFKEGQHEAGMKALGIPNTKQFFEITTITDALALWKTLQEREAVGFKGDVDEEYEDEEGNVFNKKTYLDLRRQGMI
jgi:splicing factor 3A subunit 3